METKNIIYGIIIFIIIIVIIVIIKKKLYTKVTPKIPDLTVQPSTQTTVVTVPPSEQPTAVSVPPSTQPTIVSIPPSTQSEQPTIITVPPSTISTVITVPPSSQSTVLTVPPSTQTTEQTNSQPVEQTNSQPVEQTTSATTSYPNVQVSTLAPQVPVSVPLPPVPEPIKIETPPDTQFPNINTITIQQNTGSSNQISNVEIMDQNNNVVVPLSTYIIKAGETYYVNTYTNGTLKTVLRTTTKPLYIITLNPTNIKNITIYGSNLNNSIMALSADSSPAGIGVITKLNNEPVQSYNYNLPTIDPNNPLVCTVKVFGGSPSMPLDVASIIITNKNGTIITPTKINKSSNSYTVTIQPSQIQNIKVSGNNLNLVQLIVSNCSITSMPKDSVSTSLTNAPVQNYIYYNKQLTLDTTSVSEGFKNIRRKMTLLDTFYLPLHK